MTIQLCPQCERGMKEDEQICPACGASLAINKAGGTWLCQIKVYAATIIVGLLLLVVSMPKIIHHAMHTPPEQWVMIMAIAGGLAFMGGFFGLCVALFFYYLWKSKMADK